MTKSNNYWIAMGVVVFALGCGSSSNQGSASTGGNSGVGGSTIAGGTSAVGGSGTMTTGGHSGIATGGATGNAGSAAGGADCSPADGSTSCNAPVACGAFVTGVNAISQPAAQGGSIIDGTYELTQLVNYNASGAGQPLRATKVISQGTIASTVVDQSGNLPTMSSGSYTVSGTTLTWNITCPSASTSTYAYTATGNQLILYQAVGASALATVYARTGP